MGIASGGGSGSGVYSRTRVPNEVYEGSKVLIVGEAPGATELEYERPFVGWSGKALEYALERGGLRRKAGDYSLANLCQYRPKGNRFTNLLGTDELEAGVEELKGLIEELKPNVIVAAGGWPAHYLCGVCEEGKGISLWRGSLLPEQLSDHWTKTLLSYHPSYIVRKDGGEEKKFIFHQDMWRVKEEATFPELRYPEYEPLIDPPLHRLTEIVREAQKDPDQWVSFDIETFGPGQVSCVGFAPRDDLGVCVTFQNPEGLAVVRELWESNVPKTMQYGTYDITFMRHFYGWKIGGYYAPESWDTYLASTVLETELPRGLDMLTSIYTRLPYYKQERKVWKESGDLDLYWGYNIKDIIATRLIAKAQQEEMG
jgi:DNA polymerase